jgi:hypothetical protein
LFSNLQCSSDLLSALVSFLLIIHPHEIEIGDLWVEVMVEKYIVWLEVSVNDPLVMEKQKATSNP